MLKITTINETQQQFLFPIQNLYKTLARIVGIIQNTDNCVTLIFERK